MLESRSLYSNFWCGITPQVQPGLLHPSTNLCVIRYLNLMLIISLLSVRATTREPRTTSQSGSGSGSAVTLFPWCTALIYQTCVANPARTWPSTLLTQTTAGRLMTSWCLLSRHVKQVSLRTQVTTNYYICSRAANTTRQLHFDEWRTVTDFLHQQSITKWF